MSDTWPTADAWPAAGACNIVLLAILRANVERAGR